MNMKKLLSMLLVPVLLLSVLSVAAFAQSPVYYTEGHCTELHPSRMASGPELAPGNHERYLDRLASMPEYATKFYQWLEDNAGAGGALADPTLGTKRDEGRYCRTVTTITKSQQFSYNDVSEIYPKAKELANLGMDDEFVSFISYAGAAWDAFDRDHPEVFWLSGELYYSYFGSWQYAARSNVCTVTYTAEMVVWLQKDEFDIRLSQYDTAKAVVDAIADRDRLVEEILSDCPKDDPYGQVVYLNDTLTKRNAYNSLVAVGIVDGADEEAWKCISALDGRNGVSGPVCEGYARAFKVLCDELQIPCVLVDGNAKETLNSSLKAHMWNYVRLDGGWYAVDVTWNDPFVTNNPIKKVSGHESQEWLLLGSDTVVAPGLSFLNSHAVINSPRENGVCFTNGPVLAADAYDPNGVAKYNISGTITSFGNDQVTVELWLGNALQATRTLSGTSAAYCFENMLAGDYQLKVSKPGHVTRTQELTVSDQPVTQNIKICMMGDVGDDGRVNMGDISRLYSHVKSTALLTDAYILLCADMNGDGRVNMGDISRLYAFVRG